MEARLRPELGNGVLKIEFRGLPPRATTMEL
jgi:hypothetical protein